MKRTGSIRRAGNLQKTLSLLTEQSRRSQGEYQGVLRAAGSASLERGRVPRGMRPSYIRVLSSVATTEGLERTLLDPLLKGMPRSGIDAYLRSHMHDEELHHRTLIYYLKKVYQYEKKRRTWSDRILYDSVYRWMGRVFKRKPVCGLALLHCYESISVDFYNQLKKSAKRDGAEELGGVLSTILKDERRHIAGMGAILRSEVRQKGGLGVVDLALIRWVLGLVLLDVDMRPWAFHNREVRRNLMLLGFDLRRLSGAVMSSLGSTMRICSGG